VTHPAAGPAEEAIALVATLQPRVVVMDLTMVEVGGIDATRSVLAAHPRAGVLVLTRLHSSP